MALWSQKSRNGSDAKDKMAASTKTKTRGIPEVKGLEPQSSANTQSGSQPSARPRTATQQNEVQRRAAASRHTLMAFGEILGVMMRTQPYRAMPLAAVAALVVPAVNAGQFIVAEAQSNESGIVTPLAVILWASVSADVDRRLSQTLDQPVSLAANEWKSGDIPWLIATAGDTRMLNHMLKQLQEKGLNGRPLKLRARDKDGKEAVGTFNPNAPAPAQAAS